MADQSKYLAIKDWKKHQPDAKLRNKNASLPWIKDWTDKEFDADYCKLPPIERYTLDALCRLCGRIGNNIPNDRQFIGSALAIPRQHRRNVEAATTQLIGKGFLIPTNEKLRNPQSETSGGEGEGSKDFDFVSSLHETERECPVGSLVSELATTSLRSDLPTSELKTSTMQEALTRLDGFEKAGEACRLFLDELNTGLAVALGIPCLTNDHVIALRNILEAALTLNVETGAYVADMFTWSQSHKFWKERVHDLAGFAKALGNQSEKGLPAQYARFLLKSKAKAKAAASGSPAYQTEGASFLGDD